MDYMIGEKRQISIKKVDDTYRVTIEELQSQKAVDLNANCWIRLIQLIPHIATCVECLANKQYVDFRQHIGGAYFVSVSTGYYCINIRQYYFHPIHVYTLKFSVNLVLTEINNNAITFFISLYYYYRTACAFKSHVCQCHHHCDRPIRGVCAFGVCVSNGYAFAIVSVPAICLRPILTLACAIV